MNRREINDDERERKSRGQLASTAAGLEPMNCYQSPHELQYKREDSLADSSLHELNTIDVIFDVIDAIGASLEKKSEIQRNKK